MLSVYRKKISERSDIVLPRIRNELVNGGYITRSQWYEFTSRIPDEVETLYFYSFRKVMPSVYNFFKDRNIEVDIYNVVPCMQLLSKTYTKYSGEYAVNCSGAVYSQSMAYVSVLFMCIFTEDSLKTGKPSHLKLYDMNIKGWDI